jgi:hypothetical protein
MIDRNIRNYPGPEDDGADYGNDFPAREEFRFAVEYKGGQFVKTVYAADEAWAWNAVLERYANAPDFKVLYLYPPR